MAAPTRDSIGRMTSTMRSRSAMNASTRSPARTFVDGFAGNPLTRTWPPSHNRVARGRVFTRRTAHSQRSTRVATVAGGSVTRSRMARLAKASRETARSMARPRSLAVTASRPGPWSVRVAARGTGRESATDSVGEVLLAGRVVADAVALVPERGPVLVDHGLPAVLLAVGAGREGLGDDDVVERGAPAAAGRAGEGQRGLGALRD